jgi:N-6 DNA Methylase
MSLNIAHEKLGWPSPEDIRNPSGEGVQIFARLARTKIATTISRLPNASDVKVGVLSRNPQSTVTEAPLAVVAEFNREPGDQTLSLLHRLAWNFSHTPTVVTVEPTLLRVWTCCEPPEPQSARPISDYIVQELSTAELAKTSPSDITTRAAQVLHWVNLVSGQFFRERAERFRRDRRADQMLLGNLRHVRHVLHAAGLEEDDICHDLLARIIFVQFLFDRKDPQGYAALNRNMLGRLQKDGVLQDEHPNFSSILEDYEETYRLFDWLNEKFNGDLFPGKGISPDDRARGWRQEKRHVKPKHLRLLRDFIKGDLDMPSGQLCLWPQYAFDAIPLEFISSIYEAFVSERAAREGIYYTPPALVDFILDRVLPWNGENWNLNILDPACGSGIFLVKAFQRLIHRWKRAHPNQSIRADALRGFLEKNLFGVDKDPHAVRVASFSLYLAMCDEIDPKYYWSQVSFPAMREHRLINADFFEEDNVGFTARESAGIYDLVIGNAPWGEKLLTEKAKRWAADENHEWPVVNKGIGTLFLPKAAALTNSDGKLAMIQSASSLLFNRSGPARRFRQKFFTTFQVEGVINLSALRFKVFNRKTHAAQTSVAPSCIIIFKPQRPTNQRFLYVSPKESQDSADEFDLTIDPQDIKHLYPDEAAKDPEVWTALMWGNVRDKTFLRQLKSYRTILSPGDGVQLAKREGIIFGDRKKLQRKLLGRSILKTRNFPPDGLVYLNPDVLPQNTEMFTHSRDSTDFEAFTLPQLIIKQGWLQQVSRFQARLVRDSSREGILCTQSYVTVHVPVHQRSFIEAACLSYNSAFAVYFLLLTSSRFASYRPEPLVEELLQVPIPETRSGILDGVTTFKEIDDRVRDSFGFKDAEWVLIEDLFNVSLPDFKGDANSPGRQRTQREVGSAVEPQLRLYCEYFIRVLKAGFGEDKPITARIFHEAGQDQLPYRLVAFELNQKSPEPIRIDRLQRREILAELDAVNRTWLGARKTEGGSIYHRRVVRIYDYRDKTPTIFIIKPDAYRYWTRSMGLYDADEVATDFIRWQTTTDSTQLSRK